MRGYRDEGAGTRTRDAGRAVFNGQPDMCNDMSPLAGLYTPPVGLIVNSAGYTENGYGTARANRESMKNTKDITSTDHSHDSNDSSRREPRDALAKDAMKGLRPDDDFDAQEKETNADPGTGQPACAQAPGDARPSS